jgi:ribosomal protein S14
MTLIIKRFKTALKGRKEYPNKNKSRGKRSCFKCGKSGHFIAQCPIMTMTRHKKRKGIRKEEELQEGKGQGAHWKRMGL